jgi:hypothetical protein
VVTAGVGARDGAAPSVHDCLQVRRLGLGVQPVGLSVSDIAPWWWMTIDIGLPFT